MTSLWRDVQRKNFTSLEKLSSFLEWDPILLQETSHINSFPLNLPLRLAEKVAKNTLDDPILKQFLSLKKELLPTQGFAQDPVQDVSFRKEAKLIQKYKGRALLIVSSACAMHCRYCFRKNFPYETENKGFAKELELIRKDTSLKEIILSGGDPLSLSNKDLTELLKDLNAINHIQRIRFHTRFPIGIPERIDKELLQAFAESSKQIFFVIHTNHPKELDEYLFSYLRKIQCLGIPILNQTVLLKGINDSLKILQTLFEMLVDHGVLPYYLHQLDQVQGAAHFEVKEEEGKALMRQLSSELSGYALPKYAKEQPGKSSKTLVSFF